MMDLNEDQQRRKDLILRNLQEILGEDKLSKQLSSGKNIHVYWGTATTGRPHVGYFVPMQKIADFLRADIRVTILFADLHAFLDNMKSSFELLHNRVLYYEYVVKALMKALDVPIEKLHFVRGRSYQLKEAYTKDLLRLCGMVSLRDAIRAGAEVVKQVDNPLLSGILYPLLQAIDEQHLKVDGQFGGVDQRKIFIFAEEQLPKIKLGKRFHLMNPMVPGLTGSKMSSSEENTKIDLLDTPLSVSAKIGSARCPKTTESDDNGVLAFFKHVVVPIQGQHNQIALNNHIFADFDDIRSAFDREEIREQDLKEYLTNFLNQILSKVQEHCHQQPEFVNIVSKAYPTATTSEKIEEIDREKEIESQNIITFEGPFGYSMELFPSRKVHSQDLLYFDVSGHKILPLRVLWRCSPKGRLTLGHLSALLQLKYLSTMGHQITILVSDLDAFLDRNKCPWTEMKNRSEQYIKALKDILRALNMENVVLQYSNDYEYDENFTMEMYQFASVVTRDETAPTSDGTTTPFLGSHLCPIYFALDIKRANPDLVLLGSNQRENAKLLTRIYKRLNIEVPAFLLHPELVGTDGQKMSATRPEFHLDLMQDGIKKVRQKIGKSFCEPGNAQDNVALKLCRDFLFPFHQLQWKKSKNNDDECEELSMVIERKPGNGGDLAIFNYEEIESKFSTQQLHPADLKAFVCNQIFEIFDTLRNGQVLMS